jgi:hypothetical protein
MTDEYYFASDGTARNATSEATWNLSGESEASVSSGLVSVFAPGQITLTATINGVSRSREITIASDNNEMGPVSMRP